MTNVATIDFNAPELNLTRPELKPIGDYGVCVSVNVSLPEFRRKDKQATKQTAQMNNANEKRVSTYKKLLDMPELDRLGELKRMAYAVPEQYGVTFGHNQDFISNNSIIECKNALESIQTEYNGVAKQAFLDAYPRGVTQAQLDAEGLGDLFDPSLYPSVAELEHKIGMRVTWTELPSSHPIESIHRQSQQVLVDEFTDNATKQTNNIMQELVCKRLLDLLQRMSTNLTEKDNGKLPGFHNTMIETAQQVLRLLKDCNVTQNPEVEAMRIQFQNALRGQTTEGLKTNEGARIKTKAEIDQMIAKIPTLGF